MTREKATLHALLYPLFFVTGGTAVGLGLLFVWGLEPNALLVRILGTCIILTIAAGFAMSVTRIAHGQVPEDDGR